MPETNELSERLHRFRAALNDAGIKVTPQRLEIYREIAESGEHPDAESVHRGVRQRLPSVSLDTVYRTLWTLLDLGLIGTLGRPADRIRFDANTEIHHHFVCNLCGRTIDFYDTDFNRLQGPETLRALGRVEQSHVELRGICAQCSQSQA